MLAASALPYATFSSQCSSPLSSASARSLLHATVLALASLLVLSAPLFAGPAIQRAGSLPSSAPLLGAARAGAGAGAGDAAPTQPLSVYPADVERWRALAQQAAVSVTREDGVPISSDLVLAVVQVESSGQPDAQSAAGAVGLMQVRPDTFQDMVRQHPALLAAGSLTRPADNLVAGALYLVFSAHYLDVDLSDPAGLSVALNGYNLGPEAVRQRRDAGNPSLPLETRLHAARILALYTAATTRGLS